jgi:hypothetical protein
MGGGVGAEPGGAARYGAAGWVVTALSAICEGRECGPDPYSCLSALSAAEAGRVCGYVPPGAVW